MGETREWPEAHGYEYGLRHKNGDHITRGQPPRCCDPCTGEIGCTCGCLDCGEEPDPELEIDSSAVRSNTHEAVSPV